nr:hypothetical protein [Frankia sp. Cas4]
MRFVDERVTSGAANATPKLISIIAGMAACADSIDDLDVIRSGGTWNSSATAWNPLALCDLEVCQRRPYPQGRRVAS